MAKAKVYNLLDLLKYKRSELGLKYLDVAKQLDVHPQSYWSSEHGKQNIPIPWIPKLSKLLDIPEEKFVVYMVERYETRLREKLSQ